MIISGLIKAVSSIKRPQYLVDDGRARDHAYVDICEGSIFDVVISLQAYDRNGKGCIRIIIRSDPPVLFVLPHLDYESYFGGLIYYE